jgi:hypothetical protein
VKYKDSPLEYAEDVVKNKISPTVPKFDAVMVF